MRVSNPNPIWGAKNVVVLVQIHHVKVQVISAKRSPLKPQNVTEFSALTVRLEGRLSDAQPRQCERKPAACFVFEAAGSSTVKLLFALSAANTNSRHCDDSRQEVWVTKILTHSDTLLLLLGRQEVSHVQNHVVYNHLNSFTC